MDKLDRFLFIDRQLRTVEGDIAEVVKVASGRVMRWKGIDAEIAAEAWAIGATVGEYFRFSECIIIKIEGNL